MRTLGLATCVALACVATACMGPEVESGVSRELARHRKANISQICYNLEYSFPDALEEPVQGRLTLAFDSRGGQVQLDFRPEGTVQEVSINGVPVEPDCREEHIVLPSKYLRRGSNEVFVAFTPDDASLNRHKDYLYTLLVPERARTVFPCFDQPDLKARFNLKLDMPSDWVAVSNAHADSEEIVGGRKHMVFAESGLISTYLFEITAGLWKSHTFDNGMTVYHRETDPRRIAQLPDIQAQIEYALGWMAEYTGIPMPFEKYDYVIVPGFQFGGMEHPGAILFNDNKLFLGEAPTDAEKLARVDLLAHETAHLWFGDAVTMEWFDDVWTKEVFANLFAAMISRPMFPDIDFSLKDFRSFNVRAYEEDRTEGAVPIRQRLDNLQDAGLIYGNIVYDKAPVVMRMLADLLGEEPFREGLREYLGRYMYSNATWPELIDILDGYTPRDLKAWSHSWVEEAGMPVYAPSDSLANLDAMGYGYYQLTDKGLQASVEALPSLPEAHQRLSTLANLYENMLGGRFAPSALASCIDTLLRTETNPLVASVAMEYLGETAWAFDGMEVILNSLCDNPSAPQQIRLGAFRQLAHYHKDPSITERLLAVWSSGQGQGLSEDDFTTLSFELAIRRPELSDHIRQVQRGRISNPDRRARFEFIWPAVSPSEAVRDSVFNSLLEPSNRLTEPWVETSLALLNHPLRNNVKYIVPALDEMQEVQRTGDIFFPKRWIVAVLSGHRSPEAAAAVRLWLDAHPDYPPLLRTKILQAADPLLRTCK